MRSLRATIVLSVFLSLGPSVLAGTLSELRGWSFEGEDRTAFIILRDRTVRHGGTAAAKISSVGEPKGYGAIIQSVEAMKYAGKRVRFTAWVKTADVTRFAGLVMRVEGKRPGDTLAFDNMQDRPLRSSAGWRQHEVVLDVPANASRFHIGVMLSGKGTVWLDDGKIEVVDNSAPTTGSKKPVGPRNSDFEE